MITYWEKTSCNRIYYIQITEGNVIVGYHYGSGHTDNACICTHSEFLDGMFHDFIRENFGDDVLNDVLAFLNGHPDPEIPR